MARGFMPTVAGISSQALAATSAALSRRTAAMASITRALPRAATGHRAGAGPRLRICAERSGRSEPGGLKRRWSTRVVYRMCG